MLPGGQLPLRPLPLFAAHAPAVGLNRAAFDNPQRHVNRFETELHLLGGDTERLRKTVLRLEPVEIARNADRQLLLELSRAPVEYFQAALAIAGARAMT